MAINLDKGQLKAIEQMKNGCILCGGVGSGKSRTALVYYYTKVCNGQICINGLMSDISPTTPKDLNRFTECNYRFLE